MHDTLSTRWNAACDTDTLRQKVAEGRGYWAHTRSHTKLQLIMQMRKHAFTIVSTLSNGIAGLDPLTSGDAHRSAAQMTEHGMFALAVFDHNDVSRSAIPDP